MPKLRRSAIPPSESSVYDGSICLGTIQGRAGVFKARDANGRKLGDFPTAREAMRCIVAAARGHQGGG
jgi:hypothetical protein